MTANFTNTKEVRNEIMPIQEYIATINSLIASNSSLVVNNSGIERAKILTTAIFRNAKKINMLCGGLNSELANLIEYKEELFNFIDKSDSEINFVFETNQISTDTVNAILEKKKLNPEKKIQLRLLAENDATFMKLKMNNGGNSVHFTTANNNMYRFEYNPDKFTAYGSFNRPEDVKILNELFFQMFNNGKAIN